MKILTKVCALLFALSLLSACLEPSATLVTHGATPTPDVSPTEKPFDATQSPTPSPTAAQTPTLAPTPTPAPTPVPTKKSTPAPTRKATAKPTQAATPTPQAEPKTDVVYITENGKKYHRLGCQFAPRRGNFPPQNLAFQHPYA